MFLPLWNKDKSYGEAQEDRVTPGGAEKNMTLALGLCHPIHASITEHSQNFQLQMSFPKFCYVHKLPLMAPKCRF